MLADRYDLPLSTSSTAAQTAYIQGSERLMTMYPGAIAAFDGGAERFLQCGDVHVCSSVRDHRGADGCAQVQAVALQYRCFNAQLPLE